ncbi:hypothetical protein HY947_02575 [Candidatus Gottesmanbacteria bacterium]|nr:hypothetical protein [Candidatus Gottesmanbacteria bacterium]
MGSFSSSFKKNAESFAASQKHREKNAKKTLHEKFLNSHILAQKKAIETLSSIKFTPDLKRLLLSFLIWTEGGKSSDRYVTFINSDPLMVQTFLKLLRQSFVIQEEKIRALIHMHEYHNEEKTMQFWMNITNLPKNLFSKTYRKPHTGHRKRINYQGCIRVRYYNAYIARELAALYNSCAHSLGS